MSASVEQIRAMLRIHPSDTCSFVTRPDWPTRQRDIVCSQQALAVCAKCEATLCVVHAEICDVCKFEFCAGCFDLHAHEVSQ